MQQGTKIAVVVLAIALVAVIGLICLTKGSGTAQPIAEATATPEAEQTSMPEETPQPGESAQSAEGEEVTPQETMYEGALAGLTEEEIGQMAIAEEESSERQSDDGAEDTVD